MRDLIQVDFSSAWTIVPQGAIFVMMNVLAIEQLVEDSPVTIKQDALELFTETVCTLLSPVRF